MNFSDRLIDAVERVGNPCLLGLDPHLDLLPEEFAVARDTSARRADRAAAVGDFCCELVDVAAGRVAAVKPQSAFFERFGADGVAAWERVVRAAREAGLLVIGDVKRGDIGSTAAAYAEGLLDTEDPAHCDAVTVNPLLGRDSLEPFLEACRRNDAGLYVLVRTSNPGSSDFQTHGEPELSLRIARAVHEWGAELVGEHGLSSVGAVVGATHPELLATFRQALPRTPLLLPGYGAQGAGAQDVAGAFLEGGRGALVSASRSVAFAYRRPEGAGKSWKDAAAGALDAMAQDVSAVTKRADG